METEEKIWCDRCEDKFDKAHSCFKQDAEEKMNNEYFASEIDAPKSFTLEQLRKSGILFKEGDAINIEGELYLIYKTPIGNSDKLRINLKMVKHMGGQNAN